MQLKLDFQSPEWISYDFVDTVQIKMMNTTHLLVPKENDVSPTPNGFWIDISMPPQKPHDGVGTSEIDDTINTEMQLTGLVFGNFFGSFIFSFSLQHLLGMINALQFVAHMPLNNITLPYSCWGVFGILIQIATFDFFPITDLHDFGFTETEPWS